MATMLWSHGTCVIRLLTLCLLADWGLPFGMFEDSPEFSKDDCVFNMVLRNFQPILSWELRNRSIEPTHYTLWYTYTSKKEDVKMVPHCAGITRPHCDLTHLWTNMAEMYLLWLVGSRGNTTLVRCQGHIFPDIEMDLQPPQFEVVGFTHHINVVLEFPATLPTAPNGEGTWLHSSLVIEEQSEGVLKEHILKINRNTTGNYTYVLDKLIPNTTYCVSVYYDPKDVDRIKRSPLKCTHLQPEQEPESSESAKIGGLITVLLIALVSVSTLLILKRVGYICLRNMLPQVLCFYNPPGWVLPEPLSPEAVAEVEVIQVNRKKKVWDYSYDDESDSDNEAAPRAGAGGYSMHGLTGRLLRPASDHSAPLEDSGDPDDQEAWEAEAEPPALLAPEPGPCCLECPGEASEGRGALLANTLFEDNHSSAESSADRIFFNVDLNSVSMRVLDDSDTEDPSMPCLPEETVVLEDPEEMGIGLTVASGQGTYPFLPSPSGQALWPEDAPSDRSDPSESESDVDVNIGDGYLMR